MARKQSRIVPTFVADQKVRRTGLESSDPSSQNSVPDLRDRVTVVERLLSIRSD